MKALTALPRDGVLLFSTRMARLFAYGFLALVLALYLSEVGLDERQIGLLLTLTLVGDTAVSLWITTHADRLGRRRMLMLGAVLMLLAGILFTLTRNFYVLLVTATIGVISPSGYEVGPFLSVEQAALTQLVPDRRRTQVFAWYNLAGSISTALGSLCAGGLAQVLQGSGVSALGSYRVVLLGYAAIGSALFILFTRLSSGIEVRVMPEETSSNDLTTRPPATQNGMQGVASPRTLATTEDSSKDRAFLGLRRSRNVVLRLAALFSLDAFAGGFVIQSIVSYWFHIRFNVEPGALGAIFFGANILAGVSALSAAWVAKKIGLVNTMVFTHLPSNILLILVPFMPSLGLATAMLLLRFSISQMDVPTRQSYTLAVVDADERSAAAGVTGVARTIGASLAPVFTGALLGVPALIGAPFVISGALKIVYDLSLFRMFRSVKPPEER